MPADIYEQYGQALGLPGFTVKAVIDWLQGRGPKPRLDHYSGDVIGISEGGARTPQELDALGDPGEYAANAGIIQQYVYDRNAEQGGPGGMGGASLLPSGPVTDRKDRTSLGGTAGLSSPLSGDNMGNGRYVPSATVSTPEASREQMQNGLFTRIHPPAGGVSKLPGFGGTPPANRRSVTALGAPSFLSRPAYESLLPTEHAGRRAAIELTGIPYQDYERQQTQAFGSGYSDRRLHRLPLLA